MQKQKNRCSWCISSELYIKYHYAMAKALKKLGFKFVGSTICYAFIQAVGMVNEHVADCF